MHWGLVGALYLLSAVWSYFHPGLPPWSEYYAAQPAEYRAKIEACSATQSAQTVDLELSIGLVRK